MTPEKLFHELLGLGLNWEVSESRFEPASGTVYLTIQETGRLWDQVRCPQDGGLVTCYDHPETLTWRHLNIFQHRCEITCRLPRGKCGQCGHIFRVRPPWEGLSKHFIPLNYVHLTVNEVGTDKANDFASIYYVSEVPGFERKEPLVENVKLFFEYGMAVAAPYAIKCKVNTLLFTRERVY